MIEINDSMEVIKNENESSTVAASPEFQNRPQGDQSEMRMHHYEYDHLAEELRNEVVRSGMKEFRDILKGIDDYTVFASTSLFLIGDKYNEPELKTAPGDLDVNVDSKESFYKIHKRLSGHEHVQIEIPEGNDQESPFLKSALDGAMILRGFITLKCDGGETEYPSEIFQGSSIVPADAEFKTNISGLNTLTLEGLKIQYAKNLDIEKRVDRTVREIEEALYSQESDIKESQARMNIVAEELDISVTELMDLFALRAHYVEREEGTESPIYRKKVEGVLSGLKTKIKKRRENLELLQKMTGIEED